LTLADSNDQVSSIDAAEGATENQSTTTSLPAAETAEPAGNPDEQSAGSSASRPRILIGSQRDPAAYRARPKRDWTPIEEEQNAEAGKRKKREKKAERGGRMTEESSGELRVESGELSTPPSPFRLPPSSSNPQSLIPDPLPEIPLVPRPSPLTPPEDLDAELERAMGDASMDELLGGSGRHEEQTFEPESLQSGRVVALRRDDVFVEFAGREQGILSVRQFDVPPRPGTTIQVVVQRLNPEDGLYELTLPNKAVQVDDWSDLVEGALIDVRVTGHNTGGLECEVNHIRGFIPISQVSLYRVEDLAPYVDQRLTCVITEADPERRNLVLSRRAVLEREKEQAREQMLGSLRPGQIFDGVVRKLMDFGAFVDIGGVDGLVHVSQLAWGRVKHPSDVLKEGQAVKVRIEKVDPATGKISLAYRDLMESPWTAAAQKYPPNSVVQGTVTKLMDFGAFVELEPGIEGLVHISELSHKRVWRTAEVVKEGEQVEVMIRSIDPEAQRISLSMKACAAPPEPVKKEETEDAASAKPSKKSNKPTGPLLGGLGRKTGDRFGLKW
jgi:predicted RNA-binding protein with RPS1 domain